MKLKTIMKKFEILIFTLLLLAGIPNCGGLSDDPAMAEYRDRIERLCTRLAECNYGESGSLDDCIFMLSGVVLSEACVEASTKAPCQDHDNPNSAYARICWETCTNHDTQNCENDQVLQCNNGNLWVIDCDIVCSIKFTRYSGTCGLYAPDGITTNPIEICWCD
jgi:hypothetical protein